MDNVTKGTGPTPAGGSEQGKRSDDFREDKNRGQFSGTPERGRDDLGQQSREQARRDDIGRQSQQGGELGRPILKEGGGFGKQSGQQGGSSGAPRRDDFGRGAGGGGFDRGMSHPSHESGSRELVKDRDLQRGVERGGQRTGKLGSAPSPKGPAGRDDRR